MILLLLTMQIVFKTSQITFVKIFSLGNFKTESNRNLATNSSSSENFEQKLFS